MCNLNFSWKDTLCWDCFFCQSLFCINWIIADSIFSQCIAKLLCHSTTHSFSRIFWDTRWTGIFDINYYFRWCFQRVKSPIFVISCSWIELTSVSKKSGQTIVLYQYCGLSRFFWNRRYFLNSRVSGRKEGWKDSWL